MAEPESTDPHRLVEIKATMVIQYGSSGQLNTIFVTDPNCPLEDLLVSGEGWDTGKVVHGKVRMFGPEELVSHLLNNDFRSMRNSAAGEQPFVLSGEDAEKLAEKLREKFGD